MIEALHGVCQEACSIQDIEKREKQKNKAAPSVLGGTTAPADEVVSKKAAKKMTKAKK